MVIDLQALLEDFLVWIVGQLSDILLAVISAWLSPE